MLEIAFDEAYSATIDIPTRPPWTFDMTKEQVEHREREYFERWLRKIDELKAADKISLFEKNLEVWRQLWRVVEISDVILIVVDIRHPVLHFPPSLYKYVAVEHSKPIVVVFNKVDLVSENTVRAWETYFKQHFSKVELATFSCYKNNERPLDDTKLFDMRMSKKRPRKRVYDSSKVAELLRKCQRVYEDSLPAKLDVHLEERPRVEWDEVIARYEQPDSDAGLPEEKEELGKLSGMLSDLKTDIDDKFEIEGVKKAAKGSAADLQREGDEWTDPECYSDECDDEGEGKDAVTDRSTANKCSFDEAATAGDARPKFVTIGLVGNYSGWCTVWVYFTKKNM
ncbi:hypothetical protein EV182_002716 [Spiromyces aspiralis]|uniref:Uncharacterized protein n=1 Tax=Spiromyces aspiralis TaxID=68401 RepID=A0ACC1HFD0_9FUNG|nr:hypothetical protein EV182_002716 [Spiromyces aspiralis]